jgi:hypothetical protein
MLFISGYLSEEVIKYSILEDLILVIRQSDGPAIKGGCVTRREHRVESRYFSQKTVTVQGGYGAFFAIRVPSFMAYTNVAVQSCQGGSHLSRCS